MTAVNEYQKLETTGLWRASPEDQKREVVLSFGDTSLIILDRSNAPLTHWSLSAVERINPGKRPALFEPGPHAGETLEIEDDLMINAIEKVRMAIARSRPRQGRLRLNVFVAIFAAIILAGFFWLPGALVRHAVSVIPDTKREDIGKRLLTEINKVSGDICGSRLGATSLAAFHRKLDQEQNLEAVLIFPSNTRLTTLLPGNFLLLSQTLVEDIDTPEVLAGFIVSGVTQTQTSDPLEDLLNQAGPMATLSLLTSGKIEKDVLKDHALTIMKQDNLYPNDNDLLIAFEKAQISTRPFAFARDFSGETTLSLIEADPKRDRAKAPLMSDGDWVSIQSICES